MKKRITKTVGRSHRKIATGALVIFLIFTLCVVSFAGGTKETVESPTAEEAATTKKQADIPVRILYGPHARVTPGHLTEAGGLAINSNVYDWLFRIDKKGDVIGSLVESYDVSPDAKIWTFKLRKNVKFHHGTKFTAKDVIFTIERWLDESLGIPLRSTFDPLLDRMEEVDKYTVRFYLTRPDLDFNLKFLDYNAAIVSHEYDYEQLGETKPSGTGAFQIEKFVPRERVVLKAFTDYWKTDDQGNSLPYINTLEILFVPEKETQINMLESGQADVVTDITVDQYMRLEDNPATTGMYVDHRAHLGLFMRVDQEPFTDNRVRLAMKYVVDREKMRESVNFGRGLIANDHPIKPDDVYYDDLGGIRQQDIEKAKALLTEAGYPDGLELELFLMSDMPPSLDWALAYQQMAAKAGIKIELRATTQDIYYAKYWMDAPLKLTHWGHREDITMLFNVRDISDGAWNETRYANSEFDKNVNKVAAATTAEKKKEYFSKIQKILHEEGPYVIPFFVPYFGGCSNRTEGFYMNRNFINDYRYIKFKS